jgi:tetrahydromethanopterin S-methyltransferase subunit G
MSRRGTIMGMHRDVRTTDEIICDMLADDYDFETIAKRLMTTVQHVEARFKVICGKVGRQAK